MSNRDDNGLPAWAASFTSTFERVARHLDLAEGFMLVPVELPDSITANLLGEWLDRRGLTCHSIDINYAAQPRPLLERLREAPADVVATLLFIDQLADWLPAALQLLNQQRDLLTREHPRPLLWCGPARFLDLSWRSAPDLWSIAAVPIRLPAPTMRSAPHPASVPVTPPAALYRLLLALFSPDDLERFIINHFDTEINALLPVHAPPAVLAQALVELLHRRQLVDHEFFDRLRSEHPRRYQEIEAVAQMWGIRRSQVTGRSTAAAVAILEDALQVPNQVLFVVRANLGLLDDVIQFAFHKLRRIHNIQKFPLLPMFSRNSDWRDFPQRSATEEAARVGRLPEIAVVLDAEGRPLSRQDRQQLNEIRRLIHEAGRAMAHSRPFQLVIPLAGPNNYDTRLMLREDLREAGVPFAVLDLDALAPSAEEPSSPADPTPS